MNEEIAALIIWMYTHVFSLHKRFNLLCQDEANCAEEMKDT